VSTALGVTEEADLSARIDVSVNGDPALTLKFPSPTVISHQVPTYRVFAVTPATHYSTNALVEHLSRVVDEGKKGLAVQLLQVFDANVVDLDVITSDGRKGIRVTHRLRGVVDLSSFGDGMRRSAALALTLTRASQGVLLVDEIEAGIHHTLLQSVLAKLLEAATVSQVQIVATTHSLEAVDAVLGCTEQMKAIESLSAFWVKREDDKHQVRRYDHGQLINLREGGLDIR
jgi:predicted ATPase